MSGEWFFLVPRSCVGTHLRPLRGPVLTERHWPRGASVEQLTTVLGCLGFDPGEFPGLICRLSLRERTFFRGAKGDKQCPMANELGKLIRTES